ncbi:Ribosome quality control complex subunit 2 like protein [Verticillium longisporum]|uniref:Ribosome quality control complex subunit 2 n=1 Tax=Verticillium longisporum TaxID=100787 RepID=A0A8I2ZGP1_VERLO|nr:Ribosome quality control complex subunit 2 like protein [Verticillium longisporum]
MKQRFSSLDVKVIAHELHESLVTLRLANVYDLSSKILLLKFAKPDNKKQILIDSGFRCHLTDFARTTAAAPSAFVARLRKFLKTRRLTAVSQVGTDRIIEFTFSDGQYRLFLEFFASGNVILTDAELRILTLLRNVPEGEGQEPQRVGLSYSLDNRQNVGGVPPLTRERLQNALRVMAAKAANAPTTGKKKVKPGDQLRKGLATTITELPPMLVDHAFQVTGFDPAKTPAELLDSDALLDSLLHALTAARKVVEDATSSATTTGYIIAKFRQKSEETEEKPDEGAETKREDLLYDDFHPFLPQKFADDPSVKVLTFDGFNKTVDEFFSSLEGQKLESKLTEREAAAKKKLEATRQDHAQRIEGLQEAQSLNEQKAAAIEANVERVQEAMDAVNGLVQQGMDWVNIGKLIEREQKRHNPVAETIKLPLKLGENLMTLLLGTEAVEDEDEAYETGSDASDSEDDEDGAKAKGADRRLQIEINLGLSPWANAREYYDQRRTAAVKEQKTVQHSTMALKNAEKKIMEDLKKGLKQEKAVLQPIRKQMWFEKFIWFISSDGYLVLGGKDAQQNETLYKRYLRKGDIYCHADMHGAATVIVKNKQDTPDAPIPPSTLAQAGMLADQVSKSAPTGEYLPAGSFMVRGQKNFLPPAPLVLGLGIMFRISEESKAKHVKHRLRGEESPAGAAGGYDTATDSALDVDDGDENEEDEDEDEREDEADDNQENDARDNPLQGTNSADADADDDADGERQEQQQQQQEDDDDEKQKEAAPVEQMKDLQSEAAEEDSPPQGSAQTTAAASKQAVPAKTAPAKRGKKGKAKKMAAKYKYQDEDDRAAAEALIGAAAGRQKTEAEAKARAEREAQAAAQKERRRAQHQKQQKATAEHEEIRRLMHEEGVELLEADEAEKATALDGLVGTPLVGDEIVEAIPPGPVKKGKAVKEVLERWKLVATKKGVELIKAFKPEEVINSVPVGKLKVMMGAGGGGGGKGK